MNANAFRHFYEYHFTENRKIWDSYVTQLSHEQFTQDVDYSHGSVRDQIFHLQHLGWHSLTEKIENDGSDRLQRVKEAILEDLRRYKHADGIHFDKVVFFVCGLK